MGRGRVRRRRRGSATTSPSVLTLRASARRRSSWGPRPRVHRRVRRSPGLQTSRLSADSASVALVPEHAPPLGANQLRVPSASVGRFELHTGSKRHSLLGLVAGLALGVALGFTLDVDPVACEYDYDYACSRGEAVAYTALGSGVLGAGIGALVKTERWTPVALDALPPPAPRVSGLAPRLRVLPRGGVELGVAVGF